MIFILLHKPLCDVWSGGPCDISIKQNQIKVNRWSYVPLGRVLCYVRGNNVGVLWNSIDTFLNLDCCVVSLGFHLKQTHSVQKASSSSFIPPTKLRRAFSQRSPHDTDTVGRNWIEGLKLAAFNVVKYLWWHAWKMATDLHPAENVGDSFCNSVMMSVAIFS